MSNPFRSLKYLPWSSLLLSAGLTVLMATAIDVALMLSIFSVPEVQQVFFNTPLLQLVLGLAAPFGIGALAIVVTLNFFRQIPLRADTIWALVACVLLFLFMKGQIRAVPALFVQGPDLFGILAVAVGAFTQGRRFWRY